MPVARYSRPPAEIGSIRPKIRSRIIGQSAPLNWVSMPSLAECRRRHRDVGRQHEHLRRDAAPVETRPAEHIALDEGDLPVVQELRNRVARPAPDDDQVVLLARLTTRRKRAGRCSIGRSPHQVNRMPMPVPCDELRLETGERSVTLWASWNDERAMGSCGAATATSDGASTERPAWCSSFVTRPGRNAGSWFRSVRRSRTREEPGRAPAVRSIWARRRIEGALREASEEVGHPGKPRAGRRVQFVPATDWTYTTVVVEVDENSANRSTSRPTPSAGSRSTRSTHSRCTPVSRPRGRICAGSSNRIDDQPS